MRWRGRAYSITVHVGTQLRARRSTHPSFRVRLPWLDHLAHTKAHRVGTSPVLLHAGEALMLGWFGGWFYLRNHPIPLSFSHFLRCLFLHYII